MSFLPFGSYSTVYCAANSNTGSHLTEETPQATDVWTNCSPSALHVSLPTQQINLINSHYNFTAAVTTTESYLKTAQMSHQCMY